MARFKYNHQRKIEKIQTGGIKTLQKGMIISFNYNKPNIFDKKPLLLYIWNEKNNLIHGLNLNYLSNYKFKRLFRILGMENTIVEKDEKASKLLNKDYTRVNLPAFKRKRDGDALSKTEARVEIERMYEKLIKPKLLSDDVYRTYKIKDMSSIKIINLKG